MMRHMKWARWAFRPLPVRRGFRVEFRGRVGTIVGSGYSYSDVKKMEVPFVRVRLDGAAHTFIVMPGRGLKAEEE